MQWLLLASACVVMAILQRLARSGSLEGRATLALGFLLLAAYAGGAIAQRWRVPRLTGYLVVGAIVGPSWLGLVRESEVAALQLFANGALALIAFAAGLALRLPARSAEGRTVLRAAGVAIVPPFVAVTLVVLSISPWFPLTAHQPFRDALTVALILGAFAAIASPVLTSAVRQETGDVSPRGQRTFDITVLQDAAVLLLLVLLLALAVPLSSSGATRPGIALAAALQLLGSLLAGGILAVLIAQYVRSITQHGVLVLVAFALLVALAAWRVRVEPVLLAFGAGGTLRLAFPREADGLRTAVEKCAEPAHIVFFGLAGAAIQVGVLAQLWPWALLLVGLRLASLRAGMRWAGLPNDWLGLVSQGGLAVALAAVVRRAFPEWNVSLEALLLAMIGVYQLAGPVCFHWVLRRSEGLEVAHATSDRSAPAQPVVSVGAGRV